MNSVDQYISTFPKDVQKLLEQVRATIKKAAPKAEEGMGYGMPAFKTDGKPLVYFAGYKHHIGFYATPTGHEKFEKQLSKYKQGKGSVQFPINEPIPLALIKQIVVFRVKENAAKAEKKKNERTCKAGHKYYKSSDCPTCPTCEKEKMAKEGFLSSLSAPANRALKNNGINTLEQLSKLTEKEILSFHGIGKTSIPKLKAALSKKGLKFKK